jgi:hypothetical protein
VPLAVLWPVRRLATLVLAFATLAALLVLAHIERRRQRRSVPRILWGIDPRVAVLRPLADALRRLDYPSARVVDADGAAGWADVEIEIDEGLARAPAWRWLPGFLRRRISPYLIFAWALRRFDILVFSPGSTILRSTSLEYRQLQLLRVARRKVLLLPHDADVRIPSRAHDLLFKHALAMGYPSYARAESRRLRDLEYCSQYADHIVSGADWVDSMPWWNSLTARLFAVDVQQWKPEPRARAERGGPLVVLHAAGDPDLAGTPFLVRACHELANEGVPVDLRLVAEESPETMRALLQDADVVAEQFVSGWYARFAVEGMSMEKPVLSYLRPDLLELYTLFSFAGACPIVNTSPFEIKDKLRALALDAEGRADLGRRGRQYVRDHHSIEALSAMLDEILGTLWLPPEAA